MITSGRNPREPLAAKRAPPDEIHPRQPPPMKLLLMFATAVGILAAAPCALAQTRSFYDQRGSFAGSSVTRGNSTSVYDARGSFAGSAIRNSNGTTSFFNGRGSFVGSSVNTGRR
jgi:hypothetical protein